MGCNTIVQLAFIMFVLWILFTWMHYMSHENSFGRRRRRRRSRQRNMSMVARQPSGGPMQPHTTDSVVLIPAVIGLTDLYPPTIPGNAPRTKKYICPKGYVKNKLQNFTSDKACIYEKAMGVDKFNIGGFPFFSESSTVYRCPTGQMKIKGKSIKSPEACTGDAGTNYANYVGPQFARMNLADPFIQRNEY